MGARIVRWSDPAALAGLADRLRAGAIVALPTETLYGLSCRALDREAVARIARAKRIEIPRGFVTLVADAPAAFRLATRVDSRVAAFLGWAWPAPLSAVLRVDGASAAAAGGAAGATAAVRVPAQARLRALLAAIGEPLVSTSANRHGEPPLASAAAIAAAFADEIDVVAADEALEATSDRRPSTVADCTVWPPRLLRPGRYDLERALAAWSDASREGTTETSTRTGTILFVCTGNTCRSPLAAAIATRLLEERGSGARAASAGIAATDDAPASVEARAVAREVGLDLESHQARLLTRPMVLEAALVLVMGERQREFIRVLAPEAMDRVHMLGAFAGAPANDVSDPWGGDRSRYRNTRDELQDLVERSLQRWHDPALGGRSGA